ncbi:MAG TPA: GNAT family N-acetyltransferase [Bacteroidia bacterium]|jgi:GNAT superfamily N-acetyltransferase|nr:GNAT family N-acetyltransferase [Bacteroidia bacterium]
MKFIIRKAEKKDVPEIFRLIKELAEYEKAPDEVKITAEELERDGFGPEAVYKAFVADADGVILGMALYYIKYSTWKGRCVFLEDIIVSQQYRRYGVGTKLFDTVVKACKELGLRKMDWQILDWNEPAINFYKKYNTVFSDEWLNGSLYEKQLKEINV